MRRDLLVTALLFTIVGFIAGALYTGALAGSGPAAAQGRTVSNPPAGSGVLPADHPPMEEARRWQELREKAEANPKDENAAVELANFLYDQGVWDQAIEWYQRTLEINPRNTNARTDMATCYFQAKMFDEAIKEYTAALTDEPNKPQALFGLARVKFEGKQDRAGAERVFEQLKQAHPTFEGVEVLAGILGKGAPK